MVLKGYSIMLSQHDITHRMIWTCQSIPRCVMFHGVLASRVVSQTSAIVTLVTSTRHDYHPDAYSVEHTYRSIHAAVGVTRVQ